MSRLPFRKQQSTARGHRVQEDTDERRAANPEQRQQRKAGEPRAQRRANRVHGVQTADVKRHRTLGTVRTIRTFDPSHRHRVGGTHGGRRHRQQQEREQRDRDFERSRVVAPIH
jgi:hypothetical protein